MSSLIRQSINTFIEELQTRINILFSSKVTANIDNSNYKELEQVSNKYLSMSPGEITVEELMGLDKTVIKKMLVLCDEKKDSVEYLTSRLDDHPEFYDSILSIILTYAREYRMIDDNQTDIIRNKISLYQKYIDKFSLVNPSELFEDLDEIEAILSTGFDDEDKMNIELFIAESNIKLVNEIELLFSNAVYDANEKINDFVLDDSVYKKLESKLKEMEIDVELIPTIAEDLSVELGINADVLNNIICVSVANNLYLTYSDIPEEEHDSRVELRGIVLDVLDLMKPVKEVVYYKALDIIHSRTDALELASGLTEEEVYKYIDTPLTTIEEEVGSRDEAINLKELAVLKPMIATVESLDTKDRDSKDYGKYINLLTKLLDQYYTLENKKEENIRIK